MDAQELDVLLHRVVSVDTDKYSNAYATLTREEIPIEVFREVHLSFLLLLEFTRQNNRTAFFRLHRVALLSKITFPTMLTILDEVKDWEPSELLYGIALNQSSPTAGYHFVKLAQQLIHHADPAVRWAAAKYLRSLALHHTGGRSSVWEPEFLAEMFASYLAPGGVLDRLKQAAADIENEKCFS